ncbi:MAG: tetratricopeptide repeat protein [Bryobacteraceae bacterium]
MLRTARGILAMLAIFAAHGHPAQSAGSEDAIRNAYEVGEQALRRGDLDGAAQRFLQVLALAPADVGAHTNLGVVYMRQQKWKQALAELEAARKLAPQVPGIRLNIGLSYYRQGEYGKATQPLESVVEDQPQSTQARRLLGLCYFFQERYADAVRVLEAAWPDANNDLSYLYVLAVAAGNASRHELEERALARLLEIGKDSAEYHLFIGKAYLTREDNDKALSELEIAAAANAKLPFVHYNLGVVYRRKRDFDRAKQEFLKDAALEPDVAFNYDQLGIVCQMLEDDQTATRYYLEAVRRDPQIGTSWYGLAKIYGKQKKYAEALRALDSAGAIDPKSASVHYLRGQILMQLGRGPEAKAEMATVRRLKQESLDKIEQQVTGGVYRDPQLTQ